MRSREYGKPFCTSSQHVSDTDIIPGICRLYGDKLPGTLALRNQPYEFAIMSKRATPPMLGVGACVVSWLYRSSIPKPLGTDGEHFAVEHVKITTESLTMIEFMCHNANILHREAQSELRSCC